MCYGYYEANRRSIYPTPIYECVIDTVKQKEEVATLLLSMNVLWIL